MSRKETALQTKKKIFETAVQLFKQNSYDSVTISQICQAAHVAKGTFYVHYFAKEDIIRQIYYDDMGDFVLQQYYTWLSTNSTATIKEKIGYFLLTEIMFTEYAGYEMTCRAYITNLTACINYNSQHLQRRTFTQELRKLILEGIEQQAFSTTQTPDEIFLFLESFIRGLMASWCFANGSFDIISIGKKYCDELLAKL